MRVTQQDIARLAQVSQATVSRVLSGDDRVEVDLRERVLDVMRENNYQPDVRARSLRKQETHLIGLVIKREAQDLQGDPYFSMLLSEILAGLSQTPFHLCVDVASASAQAHVYDELLRSRRVDGLILVESEPRDERISRLQEDQFPFVVIGNPKHFKPVHSVDNDNVHAGAIATQHLIDQGYRRIGFLAGPADVTVCEDRICGYREAIKKKDLQPLIWNTEFGYGSALNQARELLKGKDRPDALVVIDDFMAMGVVQAARELRLSIPSQLGLVSFNDSPVCELLENGLTSVNLNIHEMVDRALKVLLASIANKRGHEPARHIIPTSLTVRGSSLRTPEVTLV